MQKTKVVSFERDAGFFYRLSQKSMEKGDMAEGIYYLRKAASRAKGDSSYAIELAKALSAVSQYDQSNLIYLRLLAKGVKEGKCCFGLSQTCIFKRPRALALLPQPLHRTNTRTATDDEEEGI